MKTETVYNVVFSSPITGSTVEVSRPTKEEALAFATDKGLRNFFLEEMTIKTTQYRAKVDYDIVEEVE